MKSDVLIAPVPVSEGVSMLACSIRRLAIVLGVSIGLAAGSAEAQSAAKAAPGTGSVTFSKDIAPILQRACQNCHRPGMMAPMSLLSYKDARPWARAIKTKVANREMPPWFIDKRVGIQKFKDDPSLSDAEIQT